MMGSISSIGREFDFFALTLRADLPVDVPDFLAVLAFGAISQVD